MGHLYSNGILKGMLGSRQSAAPAAERAAINDILEDLDAHFHSHIEARRPTLDKSEVYRDGRLFTGLRAQKLGLVDRFGGLPDALEYLTDIVGTGEVKVEMIFGEAET